MSRVLWLWYLTGCNLPTVQGKRSSVNIKKTVAEYARAHKSIEEWVRSHEGKELKWAIGKYKGRNCRVHHATWEVEKGKLNILVTVQTYRKQGKGFDGIEEFVDDNDFYHRTYRSIDDYEQI